MPRRHTAGSPESGVSMLEIAIALAIVAVALAALAPLLIRAVELLASARTETRALALATARLEQLEALPYELQEDTMLAIRDETTNLAEVPASSSGTGLEPGDPGTAWRDAPGRSDQVGADGRSVGIGADHAAHLRRWSIADLAGPVGTERLFVQVFARQWALERREPERDSPARRPGDVWLFTIRTRVLR